MIPPSPELQRKFMNTDQLVRSGAANLVPGMVAAYPNDYVDMPTYEAIKRAMQFI